MDKVFVTLTVNVILNKDPDEDIETIISEMDCKFSDGTKATILEAEIVDYEVTAVK